MQNKANLPDAQMNVNSLITKDYRKNDAFAGQKNKPNSKPIQTQSKPIADRVKLMQCVYLQRIMKKNADRSYEKTKPKQSQFKPNSNPMSKQLVVASPMWPESAKMAQQIDVLKHQNITLEKSNFLHPKSLCSSKQYFHVSGTSFAHLEPMR
ncbi:MAG: hypothetical protein ACYST5_09200 [Planctomycetota bacterium]|jgi:hypothetical protein